MCEYDKIVKIVHEWLKFEKHFAKVSDLLYYLFQIHLHFKGRDLKNPAKPKAGTHQRQQCQGRGVQEPLFDDSPLSIAGFLCLDSIFIIAATEASDCFGSPGSLACREENVRALWTECSHLPSSSISHYKVIHLAIWFKHQYLYFYFFRCSSINFSSCWIVSVCMISTLSWMRRSLCK